MTRSKWIALVIFIFIAVMTSLTLFYRNIQVDHWQERQYVEASLREYFVPETIDYAEKYVWDEAYWIVKGNTPNGAEMYVVWKDLVILDSIDVSEILDPNTMVDMFQKTEPNSTIKTIKPAYFNEQLCWEIMYFSNQTNHSHIAFYNMNNGERIENYTLPNKTGN